MTERWRPIPKWESLYEVSDQGRVRSKDRTIFVHPTHRQSGFFRKSAGRILKPGIVRGYERVVLQDDGHIENVAVHRLVLLAFAGPCPAGMEACHANDQKSDNRLANLRWDTRSANCMDRTRNGGSPNALKTHCPHGHEYTPDNIYMSQGQRKCRTCHIRRSVERKRRIREARKAAA